MLATVPLLQGAPILCFWRCVNLSCFLRVGKRIACLHDHLPMCSVEYIHWQQLHEENGLHLHSKGKKKIGEKKGTVLSNTPHSAPAESPTTTSKIINSCFSFISFLPSSFSSVLYLEGKINKVNKIKKLITSTNVLYFYPITKYNFHLEKIMDWLTLLKPYN